MNRNERRRLAKQNKKSKGTAAVGGAAQLSGHLIALLEQAVQFQTEGRLGEAEALYGQILLQDPANAFANHLLGVIMQQRGDPLAAIDLVGKALAQDPGNPEMLNSLGNAQMLAGQFTDAEQTLLQILQSRPDHAGALAGLGDIRFVGGHYDEAEQIYRKALLANPGNSGALNNRGIALHALERIEEAKDCYRQALKLNPNDLGALKNLANALMSEGALAEAAEIYDRAIAVQPDDTGLRVNRAMMLPVVPSSVAEIADYREALVGNMDALIAAGGRLREPAREAGVTGFYLAYHASNDVPVVKKITEMYRALCPSLEWVADHCRTTLESVKGRKYRIGMLSHHFHNHTIGKLNRGFVEHLDRDRFEVTLLRTGTISDAVSNAMERAADRTIHLPEVLDAAQQMVADEKLDVLFYPDIGMDAFTYYLAYARLAPVQATSWGHPVSTGIPNMDYFISSDDLETGEEDHHYSETLVRLKTPPTCYGRPKKPEKTMTRTDFGLSETANFYLCPQTLFKFHPDYDAVLGRILEADPNGHLVIISGRYPNKQRLLFERLAKAFPDHIDRLQFVPRMAQETFMQLILNADVVLDPMFFGGGNSSAEAIALGAPIVTVAGAYLRDRVTYSFYKAMGFEDLIARDAEDYVNIAVRLATDDAYRGEMVARLNRHSDRFFENMETVRELEQFFIAAIEARRKNEPAIRWGGQGEHRDGQ